VDSTASSHEALDAAKAVAKANGCVVAVSGATDLVGARARERAHARSIARSNARSKARMSKRTFESYDSPATRSELASEQPTTLQKTPNPQITDGERVIGVSNGGRRVAHNR
jgi:hydroxyethylthiazole kinase-like sugar kinase family protein